MSANQAFDNGYWDILDLSHYLKVKVKTLYAMICDIPHYRVGKLIRFKKVEIEAWMESKRVKSKVEGKKPIEKRKPIETANLNIDRLIRKTIDQSKQEGYNHDHGKPDHVKGLTGKEVDHGLI
jgi:excisionase family DNA binding protein